MPFYFDCEVALRRYKMEADAYGDIEFWFYRTYERIDAEDGWPVVYSDLNGKPDQLLVNLSKQRVCILPDELGNWGHCTLHLTRDIRRNEKVWIGIWSIFYTSTYDILEKDRPSDTDYIWTYSLGTYRDDLEEPPPSQAPSEWIKNDWRPLALLPHYFVYSDVCPYQDYVRTVSDTAGLSGQYGRLFRSFRKEVSSNLHAEGMMRRNDWLRRYAADFYLPSDGVRGRLGRLLSLGESVRASSSFIRRMGRVEGLEDCLCARESSENWRRLLKGASSVVDAGERTETWRALLREKVSGLHMASSLYFRKTLHCIMAEVIRIRDRIAGGRLLLRLAGELLTFWERLSKRSFRNRLEVELWSPVTQELSLRSFIKDRSR